MFEEVLVCILFSVKRIEVKIALEVLSLMHYK